jgi:tetratricopeptide (TPR) repeat protein
VSFWDWFRYYAAGNIYFWWIAFIVVSSLLYPVVRRFRLWQSKRRFMERQSARLGNPQNADVRFQLAHLYAEGGHWRRTEEHIRDAVRVAQENPLYEGRIPYHFLLLMGEALYHRRKYDEAVDAFRRALEAPAERGVADARFGLGKAYFRRGDGEKAVETLRIAIEENQSNLEGYFRLAQAAAFLGRFREVDWARTEFRQVARSLPRFAGRRRLRWRLAFLLFPITRHVT